MFYLEDILELCAEAEVMADSPRSLQIFEQVKKEKGEDLCIFDCFTVIDRLAKQISKTEPISKLVADVSGLTERIIERYHVNATANMSPLQIWENQAQTRLI
ncbi:MAG TPA: hypothetical protein DIC64_01930 [Alphaproteobacteria bacterium]|nr:hypothetical protein [Alphaproteobacteria bacterium]